MGPRYLRSSLKTATSFSAMRRKERAHKKGDIITSVINAPNSFPNSNSCTKGKMYLEESKITATIITEWIITCDRKARTTICQLLTNFIDCVLALYRSILLVHFRGNF